MIRDKRRHYRPFLVISVAMAAGILYLLFRLLTGIPLQNREYQKIISLGATAYNEELLKKVGEIQGLVSFTPVLEIPAELKLGDYTMNTVFEAADLDELRMKGQGSQKIELTDTPVLFVGENSLSEMTDRNGHKISKKELQKFWESREKILQYRLTGQDNPAGTGGSQQGKAMDTSTEGTDSQVAPGWRECLAAAQLTSPADGIYMEYAQGKRLVENGSSACTKVLLTVRGKENFDRAAEAFAELEK